MDILLSPAEVAQRWHVRRARVYQLLAEGRCRGSVARCASRNGPSRRSWRRAAGAGSRGRRGR